MPKKRRESRVSTSSDPHDEHEARGSSSPEVVEEEPIELLSPKQNGGAVDAEGGAGKHNKTTIKGMWKKAFKSIKSKPKEPKEEKKAEKGGDTTDSDSKYSRMSSRQSSLKKVLRRKDSKESRDSNEEEVPLDEADPVFATLKAAASHRKHHDIPEGYDSASGGAHSLATSSDYTDYYDNSAT